MQKKLSKLKNWRFCWKNKPKKKKTEKYKKRLQRTKKKNASPWTKVNKQLKQLPSVAIQQTLLFYEALVEDIRNKYKNAQGEKEKQIISKVITGKVLKNTEYNAML